MEELDLKELFNIFWSRKVYIALITIIFVLIGVVYTLLMVKPKYKASTRLILAKMETTSEANKDSITSTEITLNQKLLPTYSALIKEKSLLTQVINNFGIEVSEKALEKNVSINLVSDSELIEITIINENSEYAALIANELARVFIDKVSEIYNINNVSVIRKAEADDVPYNINHTKDIVIFAFIGIVVAAVYALVANMLDTTIKTAEDIDKHVKLTVLAEIPLYESEITIKKGGRK